MSPEVVCRVVALFRDFHPPEHAAHQLAPHEVRLLKLLTDVPSYKTAAAELGNSVHTIRFRLRRIYEKLAGALQVRSRGRGSPGRPAAINLPMCAGSGEPRPPLSWCVVRILLIRVWSCSLRGCATSGRSDAG